MSRKEGRGKRQHKEQELQWWRVGIFILVPSFFLKEISLLVRNADYNDVGNCPSQNFLD
jgi:hypothetical protein